MPGLIVKSTVYIKVFPNTFELHQVEADLNLSVSSNKSFTTERLLVGQFSEAAEVLRNAMKRLYQGRWLIVKPVVVIQPMDKLAGGLSEVEERILKELAADAGARKTIVWIGHELTDQEILARSAGV